MNEQSRLEASYLLFVVLFLFVVLSLNYSDGPVGRSPVRQVASDEECTVTAVLGGYRTPPGPTLKTRLTSSRRGCRQPTTCFRTAKYRRNISDATLSGTGTFLAVE